MIIGRITRREALPLLLASCFMYGAGTAAHAQSPAVSGKPARVLVADFTPAAGLVVQLDTSPGAIAQRQAAGLSVAAARAKDIRDVQNAAAETLVTQIQAMGLSATRVPPGTNPAPDELLVTGQITAIAEGSRARRMVVGFGAGKSAIQGKAELLRGSPSGPLLLQSYNTSANSGHMPGLGVGAAASGAKSAATALSGGAHLAGEASRTPVEDQAVTIAKRLASNLRDYFISQHWVAATD